MCPHAQLSSIQQQLLSRLQKSYADRSRERNSLGEQLHLARRRQAHAATAAEKAAEKAAETAAAAENIPVVVKTAIATATATATTATTAAFAAVANATWRGSFGKVSCEAEEARAHTKQDIGFAAVGSVACEDEMGCGREEGGREGGKEDRQGLKRCSLLARVAQERQSSRGGGLHAIGKGAQGLAARALGAKGLCAGALGAGAFGIRALGSKGMGSRANVCSKWGGGEAASAPKGRSVDSSAEESAASSGALIADLGGLSSSGGSGQRAASSQQAAATAPSESHSAGALAGLPQRVISSSRAQSAPPPLDDAESRATRAPPPRRSFIGLSSVAGETLARHSGLPHGLPHGHNAEAQAALLPLVSRWLPTMASANLVRDLDIPFSVEASATEVAARSVLAPFGATGVPAASTKSLSAGNVQRQGPQKNMPPVKRHKTGGGERSKAGAGGRQNDRQRLTLDAFFGHA